ncbi:MAG: hypothetical protein FWD23_16430 [Oscillospiraceae bacterium]|nr:hypothetical protein [Oscillospiraceae bacterium]
MLKETALAECILESVKAQITNVASLEEIIAKSDSQKIINAAAKQYITQIDDNKRQIEKINGFKSSLYENLIDGIISKDDHKQLKEKYIYEETQLREANSILQEQLEDVLAGKSERLKWAEHFKRFDDMTEIDRRTVVNLIHSIKIKSKTELEITFNYQSEYESALALIRKEVA